MSQPTSYRWPKLGAPLGQSQRPTFAPLARPSGSAGFSPLASPKEAETAEATAAAQAQLAFERGRETGLAQARPQLDALRAELDAACRDLLDARAQARAQAEHAKAMADGFMIELLGAVGQGKLALSPATWIAARDALVAAIGGAPQRLLAHPDRVIDAREALDAAGVDASAALAADAQIPPGELRAESDGRTWAVSLQDVARDIAMRLLAESSGPEEAK